MQCSVRCTFVGVQCTAQFSAVDGLPAPTRESCRVLYTALHSEHCNVQRKTIGRVLYTTNCTGQRGRPECRRQVQACGRGTRRGTEKPEIVCGISESMEECNFFMNNYLNFNQVTYSALSKKYIKNVLDKYQLY